MKVHSINTGKDDCGIYTDVTVELFGVYYVIYFAGLEECGPHDMGLYEKYTAVDVFKLSS